jgi:hypothetical protein
MSPYTPADLSGRIAEPTLRPNGRAGSAPTGRRASVVLVVAGVV